MSRRSGTRYPPSFFAQAIDKVNQFRELAAEHGVDADAVLAGVGLTPEVFANAPKAEGEKAAPSLLGGAGACRKGKEGEADDRGCNFHGEATPR